MLTSLLFRIIVLTILLTSFLSSAQIVSSFDWRGLSDSVIHIGEPRRMVSPEKIAAFKIKQAQIERDRAAYLMKKKHHKKKHKNEN